MNSSGVNTVLLIIIIILIIGGVVWWDTTYGPGSQKPQQQNGLQVNVTGTAPSNSQQH
jgi:hypothetical protein